MVPGIIYIITLIPFSGKVLKKKINTSKPPGMVQFYFFQLMSITKYRVYSF